MNTNILLPTRPVQRIENNDDDEWMMKGLSPSVIYMRGKGGQQYKVSLNTYKQPILSRSTHVKRSTLNETCQASR
jgi:hypothetical protein